MPTLHPVPEEELERRLANASRQFDERILTTISAAGEVLLALPERERLWWLVYLLESLDRAPEAVAVLERLRAALDDRLASGGW